MRFRFSSFVVDLVKFRSKVYSKMKILFAYRLDLFRVRVYFYNPMGVI